MPAIVSTNDAENYFRDKPRIVHIDDDINMLELFYYNFRKVFDVVSIEDWEQALSQVDFSKVDAVVTDYEMPEINGLDMLANIKQINEEIPVIFYTGQGNEEIAREAFIRGATDYFTKELFSFAHKEKLINVINKAVEMRHEKRRREASEEKFRMLAESAPVAIMIFNHKGGLYSNSISHQITGYSDSELKQMNLMNIIHPESRQTFLHSINNPDSFSDLETKEIEIAIRTKTGNIKWLMARNKNIIFENSPCRLTTAIDITEKKKFEQAMIDIVKGLSFKTGSEYFDKLTELLAGVLDADVTLIGEVNEDNPGFINTISFYAFGQKSSNISYDLKGTPCANVVGKSLCVYPSNTYQLFPDDEILVEQKIEGYIGYPLFSTQGKPMGHVVALFKQPIKNVELASSILELFASRTAVDMERTNAEQALIQERNLMKQYIDHSDDIVIVIDKDYHTRIINKAGKGILEYDESDIIGKNWFDCFIPEKIRKNQHDLFSAFMKSENDGFLQNKGLVLTKSGKEIPVTWKNTLQKNERGEIIAVLCTGKKEKHK
ncbi:MAG: PAS domain S-box protein [Firmicutes bacterium]|nr:PAS domain S-box protein [Bacillota bacterium]